MSRWGRLITAATRPVLLACLIVGVVAPGATALSQEQGASSSGNDALQTTSHPASGLVAAAAPFDTQLLALVNRFRISNGRSPLTALADLTDRATVWSAHLRDVGTLSHDAGLGVQAASICSVRAIRENVAFADEATPAHILANYVASPPHRANLLAADVRFVGIGTVSSASPTVPTGLRYWNTMKFVGGRCPSSAETATQYRSSTVSIAMTSMARQRQLVNLSIVVRTSSSHLSWVAVYFTSKVTGVTMMIYLSTARPTSVVGQARLTFSTHATSSGTYTAVYGGGRTGTRIADLGSVSRHSIAVTG